MKKLTTLLLALALATPIFAQYNTSQQRSRYNHFDTERYYGIRLGLNIASLSSSMADMDMSARAGFAVGGVYGLQLANSTPLWLEAGLFYAEKGGKQTATTDASVEKITCRMSYLQIPVVVKYAFDVADDLYVQPFIGAYAAIGLGGTTKYYTVKAQDRYSKDSFDLMNRPDVGLRIGCGAEYQMIYAELGFDFGIANISKDEFERVRNQSLFINIGVNF